MSTHITSPSELPPAHRYVMMRDTFLSGWGEAEGKDAIFIYPCDSHAQAEIVQANGEARDDQDRISIQPSDYFDAPHMREFPADWHVHYFDPSDGNRWFEPEAFATEQCPDCEGEGCEGCDDLGRVRKVRA